MIEARVKRLALMATSMVIALCATPAMAQWAGKGEAGLSAASGNTDARTANARLEASLKADAWEHSGTLAGQYARSDGDTHAKRWEIGAQTHRAFSDSTFAFGGLRYEEDHFSGFDYQGVVTTGVGRKFIDNDTTKLSGQAGIGYKFFRAIGASRKESKLVGVASFAYEHQLNASTALFNRFSTETTSDNTFLQNDMGVTVKMSDPLALAVAYGVRHNTDPPVGFRKTDTFTTLNLVYEFK
jgi:putative salt-induced outer membrane protein